MKDSAAATILFATSLRLETNLAQGNFSFAWSNAFKTQTCASLCYASLCDCRHSRSASSLTLVDSFCTVAAVDIIVAANALTMFVVV